ncbi:MAG: hypothetical protein M3R69_09375 [Acidobacteriota bacterium]|nr:hypothetical protein [Acidobacteriota bacterium]
MKRLIATLVSLVVLSMAALPVAAQTRSCPNRPLGPVTIRQSQGRYTTSSNRGYRNNGYRNDSYRNDGYTNDVYNNDVYTNNDYRYGDTRSVWQKHRDKITTAGGAVSGALLGSLIGGKRGAAIGAITGGAGAAVYTYKVRDRNRRY